MVILIRSRQNIMLESPHKSKTGSMAPSCAGLQMQASSPIVCMSGVVSSAHDVHRTHLFVTHAPETLFGSLILGGLLVIALANTPALTIDESLGNPKRRGIAAFGDSIIKDPLDRLAMLLQALVEQAKVAEGGRGGECPAGLRRWCWRRMTRDGRIELVVKTNGGEAVLLPYDAVCLAHVGREELIQPILYGPQPLVLVQPANVRLCQGGKKMKRKWLYSDCHVLVQK